MWNITGRSSPINQGCTLDQSYLEYYWSWAIRTLPTKIDSQALHFFFNTSKRFIVLLLFSLLCYNFFLTASSDFGVGGPMVPFSLCFLHGRVKSKRSSWPLQAQCFDLLAVTSFSALQLSTACGNSGMRFSQSLIISDTNTPVQPNTNKLHEHFGSFIILSWPQLNKNDKALPIPFISAKA